jgi:NhaP-type Na+/H+ or K+/H+ antiporter
VVESASPEMALMTSYEQVLHGIHRFVVIFLGSAGIGTVIGLVCSLVLKHVDLYYNPSLEFALMLCFVYIPYAFAEGKF